MLDPTPPVWELSTTPAASRTRYGAQLAFISTELIFYLRVKLFNITDIAIVQL